jgi:RNA polymerase sigma factor (TIGR02999 family)
MPGPEAEDVTTLLQAVQAGDAGACQRLFVRVEAEMKRLARAALRHESPGDRTETTSLVDRALLRLADDHVLQRAPNRRYLFAAAAQIMRRLLIDRARHRARVRRGGGEWQATSIDEVLDRAEARSTNYVELHDALERLSQLHERAAEVVTLRFLAGFSEPEVARMLEVSLSTVQSDWRFARSYLHAVLSEDQP